MGTRLALLRNELVRIDVELSRAYPRSGPEAEPARCLDGARQAIDKARRELEYLLYEEHPREAATSVYYSGAAERAYDR